MQAAKLVLCDGWSSRKVARYTGFNQSTIVRWVEKARGSNLRVIPTLSSRPHHHPQELSSELVATILRYRREHRRCAEVLHHLLSHDGYGVSLSSVKRTLRRHGISRFSRWKKWHSYPPRPVARKPGILVEIDTIHDGPHKDRLYVYTLLDVCSRWAYAWPSEHITTHRSLAFVERVRLDAPFPFSTIQSDHGSEFSRWFTKRIVERGMAHRHSRVRTPSDNGHIERFIRTLQEECLNRLPRKLRVWRHELPQYLEWYNTKRPHMALAMQTPLEVMRSY